MAFENLTFRKKFALVIFLVTLIRRVYVCLTTNGCDNCKYADRCEEDTDEMFDLVSAISMRVRRYMIKEA